MGVSPFFLGLFQNARCSPVCVSRSQSERGTSSTAISQGHKLGGLLTGTGVLSVLLLPETNKKICCGFEAIYNVSGLAGSSAARSGKRAALVSRADRRCKWTIMPLTRASCGGMKISLDKWARGNRLAVRESRSGEGGGYTASWSLWPPRQRIPIMCALTSRVFLLDPSCLFPCPSWRSWARCLFPLDPSRGSVHPPQLILVINRTPPTSFLILKRLFVGRLPK